MAKSDPRPADDRFAGFYDNDPGPCPFRSCIFVRGHHGGIHEETPKKTRNDP